MHQTPKGFEVQERARGPLSPCQVWRGSDFTRRRAVKNVEFFVTGSIARLASRRYLIYSEADVEVFRPAWATRCADGGEIWNGGGSYPSSVANFTPIGATIRVQDSEN